MPNSIIYTTNLKDYNSLVWHGEAVFRQYAKLKNHLKQHLGEEYAMLFAEPHITEDDLNGTSNASWTSQLISGKAVSISDLPADKQNICRNEMLFKVDAIRQYAQQLLISENHEDNKWGQLIMKAIEIPDQNCIMTEDDNIVLVLWGFEPVTKNDDFYNFKRSLATPVNPPPPVISEEPKDEETDTETPPDTVEKEIAENVQEQYNTDEEEKMRLEEEQKQKEEEERKENERLEEENNTDSDNKDDKTSPPTNDNDTKTPWWKRLWWLWLLLFLLLLIMFLFRHCGSVSNPLPPEPGKQIPIDTTKIVNDPDSTKIIVSDRLNIALIGENKDINAFARKFKQLYPEEYYQVIYYDTLTVRMQIQIPENEREKIKNELKAKMPEFEMLIWYEGIFQRNYRPRDPGFNIPNQQWYHEKVKAYNAWDITQGDSSLVIAIIDDGFDLTHPEFQGKIYSPWNVPDASQNVNTGQQSIHGTHVAGIALGLANNGQGVSGIAPDCRFMPVQVGDYNGVMSSTSVIDGILYAMNQGADVINMSLGMGIPPEAENIPPNVQRDMIRNLYLDEEEFWNELFQIAYDRNIIIILAAGNSNVMIGLDPMQRSNHTIKVSAVAPDESKAGFSNYGDFSTISAPGVQIYSSLPNRAYNFLDGTSMAAPIVTGGVALIKTINPALTFDQIVDLIQSTGIPVNSPNQNMGNIIQLDRALDIADYNRRRMPRVDCPDLQNKIDSLLQEIEKIKELCPDSTATDTLRIPEETEDFNFAVGRWKSTTDIRKTINGRETDELVTIYFDFYANGTGRITLVEEDNTQCSADLRLSISPGQFDIDQTGGAVCNPPPTVYEAYVFECTPDATGCAECVAQNKSRSTNNFRFKLVKIR